MKKIVLFIGLCILFTGFVSLSTRAQEAPAPPENFIVFEEFVQPADMPAFIKVQKKTIDLWKKHQFDIPIYTYRTDESSFYWVVPIENFGGIDALFKKGQELQMKMKEDGFDGTKEFRDLSTGRQTVLHWRKDLSYHPSGEFGQSPDKGYCEWTFFYMKQGHEKEAKEATKKYIEFYDSVDENYEWDVYEMVFGHDVPCWVFMVRAESELALRELEKDLFSKYSEDLDKLWTDYIKNVRRMENRKGWFLPKWSLNLPE
ncbi:MAG: hypothetical protein ABFS16_15610 [Bacteroidota bacterium]